VIRLTGDLYTLQGLNDIRVHIAGRWLLTHSGISSLSVPHEFHASKACVHFSPKKMGE